MDQNIWYDTLNRPDLQVCESVTVNNGMVNICQTIDYHMILMEKNHLLTEKQAVSMARAILAHFKQKA